MGLLEAHATLARKHAVVVGGAFGIDRAITLELARAGIAVARIETKAAPTPSEPPITNAQGPYFSRFILFARS